MTLDELTPLLSGMRSAGRGFIALCPSHHDKSASLSIREGNDGRILLHCFAGCSITEICTALSLRIQDLFVDSLPDREALDVRRRTRERQQTKRKEASHREGLKLDVLRESEHLIRTARGLDIKTWSNNQLDAALNRVAGAYETLERDHEYSV